MFIFVFVIIEMCVFLLQLYIEVLDDNDNAPIFELSRYSARFPEDLPIDQTVLEGLLVWYSYEQYSNTMMICEMADILSIKLQFHFH